MKRIITVSPLALLLSVLLFAGMLASLTQGPMSLPAGQSLLAVWDGFWGSGLSQLKHFQQVVIWELRLPRTLLAMAVGALLSICGAVTQGLFRNPLADPGIIGVSTGASLGAALAIVLLPAGISVLATPLAAFAGGLLTTLMVYRLAQSSQGTSVFILLLAGIAIAAFAGAVISFLTYLASDADLRDLTLWGMGTLNGAKFWNVLLVFLVFLFILGVYQCNAAALNALTIGEPEARHMGIDVERLKIRLIVFTALGVGVAVSVSGIIGFVGLVVPHLVRMLVGPDHRSLIPLSALAGALLLLLADVISRLLLAPAELPVGIMTSVVGAPFFTFLLIQQRKQLP